MVRRVGVRRSQSGANFRAACVSKGPHRVRGAWLPYYDGIVHDAPRAFLAGGPVGVHRAALESGASSAAWSLVHRDCARCVAWGRRHWLFCLCFQPGPTRGDPALPFPRVRVSGIICFLFILDFIEFVTRFFSLTFLIILLLLFHYQQQHPNRYSRSMRRLFWNVMRIVPRLLEVLLLPVCLVLFYGCLGVFLFRDVVFIHDTDEANAFFSTFPDAFWNMFILLTTANNPDVMIPAYTHSRLWSVYFISFLVIGWAFLLNLVLATGEEGEGGGEERTHSISVSFLLFTHTHTHTQSIYLSPSQSRPRPHLNTRTTCPLQSTTLTKVRWRGAVMPFTQHAMLHCATHSNSLLHILQWTST